MKYHPLTLDDLATAYDRVHHARRARTLPIQTVIRWARASGLFEIRKGKFFVKEKTTHNV